MTTAQLDHLQRIDAHLANLLEIAAKRSLGEWKYDHIGAIRTGFNQRDLLAVCSLMNAPKKEHHNADFIASCAGNAEAGWIATRGEIADLIAFNINCRGWKDDNGCAGAAIQYIQLRMARILAAFPLGMLES